MDCPYGRSTATTKRRHRTTTRMLGFGSFESAARFRTAFNERRQYLRVRHRRSNHVPPGEQRRLFLERWRFTDRGYVHGVDRGGIWEHFVGHLRGPNT